MGGDAAGWSNLCWRCRTGPVPHSSDQTGLLTNEHAGRILCPDVNARDRRGRPIGNLSCRMLGNTATA